MPQISKSGALAVSILRECWPEYPNVYLGASGTALVYRALLAHPRSTVVVPAFFCPNISRAIALAGKNVIHVDADRDTLLPSIEELGSILRACDSSDTILFIDHSFGYPFTTVARLRQAFPKLLIVEDCARALGVRIQGELPGAHADWLLLSMYKTVPGCQHGSALLARTPLPLGKHKPLTIALRERVANIRALRFAYHYTQRFRMKTSLPTQPEHFIAPTWCPLDAAPNSLCLKRFAAALLDWDSGTSARLEIAEELMATLRAYEYHCVTPADAVTWPAQFVSFCADSHRDRDELIRFICARGAPVGWSWHIVPAHYRCFSDTFPSGAFNSLYIAEHMIHLRVALFSESFTRRALFAAIRTYKPPRRRWLSNTASAKSAL